MIYLFGGFAALLLGLVVWRTVAGMDSARLARIVRWTGIVLLGAAGIYLVTRQAVFPALMSFLAAGLLRMQATRGWRLGGGSGPSPGQTSNVATDWLEMTLDHGTGETAGLVLKGRFRGRRLAEMSLDDLIALRGELRVEDPEGAKLLDAYMARVHPDADDADAAPPPRGRPQAMTREEALNILGLPEGADVASIREAHRRLMQQMHPDRGGSDYLAAQINAARDYLLG